MATRQIARRAPTNALWWNGETRHRDRQTSQRLARSRRLVEVVAVGRLTRNIGCERRKRVAVRGFHIEEVCAITCGEWRWQREGEPDFGELREHLALEAQTRYVGGIAVDTQHIGAC